MFNSQIAFVSKDFQGFKAYFLYESAAIHLFNWSVCNHKCSTYCMYIVYLHSDIHTYMKQLCIWQARKELLLTHEAK